MLYTWQGSPKQVLRWAQYSHYLELLHVMSADGKACLLTWLPKVTFLGLLHHPQAYTQYKSCLNRNVKVGEGQKISACGAYLSKDTKRSQVFKVNTVQRSGSVERKHVKRCLSQNQKPNQKYVRGKTVSQEFNYNTPVFCHMSIFPITKKSWVKWETNPTQEKRDLQISDVSCAVRIQCRQLSQASQIIKTTLAAIQFISRGYHNFHIHSILKVFISISALHL